MALDEIEAHTPRSESTRQATAITQAQKQALMDNLQLEITERARKLRAQYTLQAQDLRSRLERRVARIPMSLRDRKIQDLIDEHAEKAKPKPAPPVAVKRAVAPPPASEREIPQGRGFKRPSDQISSHEDKENTISTPPKEPFGNAKKRTKTTTAASKTTVANSKAPRAASRNIVPSTVLSPRSHNSRTLPRSPIKPLERPTSTLSRPASPIKPAAVPAKAPSRAPSRQTKRTATATTTMSDQENIARTSDASNTSAATTIIKRCAGTATGAGAKTRAMGKRTAATTKAASSTTARKNTVTAAAAAAAATQRKENIAPFATTTAGGRTLRKRN